MTVAVETEVDITGNFLSPKRVKENPSSFTQKAEHAMTIKIVLGPIQIKELVVNNRFSKWTQGFRKRQNEKASKRLFHSLKNNQMALQ